MPNQKFTGSKRPAHFTGGIHMHTIARRMNRFISLLLVVAVMMTMFVGLSASADSVSIRYRSYAQGLGVLNWQYDGSLSGTTNQSRQLEAVYIEMAGTGGFSGTVQYRTHVQNVGWTGWTSNGTMSGSAGSGLRLEAIQVKITGELANHYDVYYRVHVQNYGWMKWVCNGATAGTTGLSLRAEALEIKLVAKNTAAPADDSGASSANESYNSATEADGVRYISYAAGLGWLNWQANGSESGTTEQSRRLESIRVQLSGDTARLNDVQVQYHTHIQDTGWTGWVSDGAMSGNPGSGLRLEAFEIRLTGTAASNYHIWYRVYVQNYGWLGWACDGATAGTTGLALRAEAIEIKLLSSSDAAPGSTANAYIAA